MKSMELFVHSFVFNKKEENSYLLWNEAGDCLVIDPGCATPEEEGVLTAFIAENNLLPRAILLTHGHFDHVAGVPFVMQRYGCGCWVHSAEEGELELSRTIAHVYGFERVEAFQVNHYDEEGALLNWGGMGLRVLHIPGHTEGSSCLYMEQGPYLFAGDALIKGSLGFVNNGYAEVLAHLEQKVYPLPDETVIYYGHGPSSTLGEEKVSNRFFKRMKQDGAE